MSYIAQEPEKPVFSNRINFGVLRFVKEIDIQFSNIIKARQELMGHSKHSLQAGKQIRGT